MYITVHKSLNISDAYIRISHVEGDIYYIRHNGLCSYIFIDDLIENIESAKKLGWNTIHFKNYNSLKEELHYLGIETSELN